MQMFQSFAAILLLLTFMGQVGCTSLADEMQHPAEHVPPPAISSLSRMIDSTQPKQLEQPKTGMSAALLQEAGWDALAQRLALVEAAQHSIDIQYYIWNMDRSGRYLASRLIAAAKRGVQVRVMLDDINLNERESLLAALDEHSQIEIRIFNPIPSRRGVAKWLNVLGDFSRLNRRMHNKSFTVDGVVSIVGGRNIGDEYFDLSDELNFRDRDVLLSGTVVADIHNTFQQYWNSRWSYPVSLLTEEVAPDFDGLYEVEIPRYNNHAPLPDGQAAAIRLLQGLMSRWTWTKARFVADRPVPLDVDDTSQPKMTARTLADLSHRAEKEILVESAYLIFDDRQLRELQKVADKGVRIKALTNSMASNDLITNHSGYAARRQAMLESGMQLYELKPDAPLCIQATGDPSKCAPTAAYGLHAKSVVFDRKIAVIGSFNLNLRSTYLNTESLLLIEDTRIAEKLADNMQRAMDEKNSWRLGLQEGELRWFSGEHSWSVDPETEGWDRIKSHLLQLLPIEKYL